MKHNTKDRPKHCTADMTYEQCELQIIRDAIDHIEKEKGMEMVLSPEVQDIVNIVETFIIQKKRVCYGGTAINNILPVEDQFYDKDTQLPDYDFFSPEALKDAKELADIYFKAGYTDVEAKSGVHHGTYKVFVNFIPIADITYVPEKLYKNIKKKSLVFADIYYAPPNYLRMAMYLELSRPKGDVSRWEKVIKRLSILNKNYPLDGDDCKIEDIQRELENKKCDNSKLLFNTMFKSFVNQGVVFFGAMANSLYMKYIDNGTKVRKIPDFDVLSSNPKETALIVKERLEDKGIKNVKITNHDGVGEIIAPHTELSLGDDTLAFIYHPLGCHSYNVVRLKDTRVRIATIDTMLSFYLAFIYADLPYYDVNRILCMSEFLFKVQEKNRLNQRGPLRRFTLQCYGKQATIESMRKEKSAKFNELKNNRRSKEYQEWFLRYVPIEIENNKKMMKARKEKTMESCTRTLKKRSNGTKKTRKNSIVERVKNIINI